MNQMDFVRTGGAVSSAIKIHEPEDFAAMRRAGRLAAETLDFITPYVVPGVSTEELDRLCHEFIVDHGAIPAPLNYRNFPKSICTSVNHVVCHGIPSEAKRLQVGDIINIDVTVILDGWHGDTSRMFLAGDVKKLASRLVEVTYEAMMLGIAVVRPGATLGDIGRAIQSFAEAERFSVVEDFCGHGLGRIFHDSPSILHFWESRKRGPDRAADPRLAYGPNEDLVLREGMFFTVEPMINAGKLDVKILDDGWTAVTRDKSLSAQFEHSIGVTGDGHEIFTLSPKGWTRPPYE